MKRVEVLAPAGSMESLYAAINKGADAVYLGGNKFSARAYASNFDNDNMIKAIDYAHSYDVKVYVTLNTILKENEIDEAVKYVGFLYEIGVDALIIQDVGLLKRIREDFKDFELHASTQLTVHNGEAALYFKDKGFHRIVLSRELSLDEIKKLKSRINSIENEKEVLKKSNKELKFKLQNSRYKLLDLEKKLNDANFNLAIEKKIKNPLLK